MLVRFFDHGKVKKGELTRTGGGGAVRKYLLFDKEDKTKIRSGARLIYGNDIDTTEVINGIKNSKIYTSGVLSFAPEESITDAQKIEIIESFEQNLFPGLMKGEYSGYWVEHKDKDRQELHFVFAEIHLPSGKALPVYYIGKDFDLVDSWKDLINIDYGLEDPNDPKRKRAYRLKGYEYALKKQQEKDKLAGKAIKDEKVFDEEKIGEWLIEEIADDESIQTQADVIRVIAEAFEITRVAKDGKSISIKNPVGGRNIKLKGMMYEREFTRQRFESLGKTQTRERKNRSELQAVNRREREKRKHRLEQRFEKRRGSDRQLDKRLRSELTEFKQRTDQTSPEPDQLIDSAIECAESKRSAAIASDIKSDRDHQNDSDKRSASTWSNGERRERKKRSASSESTGTTPRRHRPATPSNLRASRDDYPAGADADTKNGQTLLEDWNANGSDAGRTDNGAIYSSAFQLLSIQPITTDPSTDRAKSKSIKDTQSAQLPYAHSKSGSFADRYPSAGKWWYQYRQQNSQERLVSAERLRLSDALYYPKPLLSSLESVNHAAYFYPTTGYRQLSDIIERFAQQSGPDTQSARNTAIPDHRLSHSKAAGIDVTELVSTAVNASQSADKPEDPAAQSANHRLLRRIKQATEVRSGNTETRTKRISALTRQNPINLEPLGFYTTRRRKQVRKFTDRFKEFDSDVKDQYFREQQRTAKLRKLNQRAREVKDGYDYQSERINAVTVGFSQLCSTVKAIVGLITNLLRRLFNSLSKDFNSVVKINVDTRRPLSAQQKTNYINSRPQSVSWYNQLKNEIKTLPKEERRAENVSRPRMR
ncbi:relaxase/mobilization nuclease domain-containing protein [Moraxella osloensis]|nr:relaxase/mobilization nuclease domain-containing protein [Moraxella osloensis]MBW4010671.1 relaxase/mobilization nuclease domain-containing protein [Moraxella osloensis]